MVVSHFLMTPYLPSRWLCSVALLFSGFRNVVLRPDEFPLPPFHLGNLLLPSPKMELIKTVFPSIAVRAPSVCHWCLILERTRVMFPFKKYLRKTFSRLALFPVRTRRVGLSVLSSTLLPASLPPRSGVGSLSLLSGPSSLKVTTVRMFSFVPVNEILMQVVVCFFMPPLLC